MRIHIITIGKPKPEYARRGWTEYHDRLKHYHHLRITHIDDKHNDARHIMDAAGTAYKVVLEIKGQGMSSEQLAAFLDKRSMEPREVCFIIGGPAGLPGQVIKTADYKWSLSDLTLPHDLAMVVLAEALYRASSINAGLPYHK